MLRRDHGVLRRVSPTYPPPRGTYDRITRPSATVPSCEVLVRLACFSHADSVQSEPGSNSSIESVEPQSRRQAGSTGSSSLEVCLFEPQSEDRGGQPGRRLVAEHPNPRGPAKPAGYIWRISTSFVEKHVARDSRRPGAVTPERAVVDRPWLPPLRGPACTGPWPHILVDHPTVYFSRRFVSPPASRWRETAPRSSAEAGESIERSP